MNPGKTEETSQQRAEVDIAQKQVADWKQRWQPRLKQFAADTTAAGAADSQTRRHATALAGTDASAAFAGADRKALNIASNTGTVGSAKQKLGIVGMGNDEATSTGFGSVAADQSVDDSTVQGLNAVTHLAQGQKADTINAIGRTAALSGQQAQTDAEASLQSQAGYAGLAGKLVGTSAGLYANRPAGAPDYTAGLNFQPNDAPINPYGLALPTSGGR